MKILVLTISDRASQGVYNDQSGPVIEQVLRSLIAAPQVVRSVVPDDKQAILNALGENTDKDVILTTGGTGLSPRDITPDVTTEFCDRLVPGIAEFIRSASLQETPRAVLSRGVAGQKGHTLIVNFPGSPKAAEFCARLIAPLLAHALEMMKGKSH